MTANTDNTKHSFTKTDDHTPLADTTAHHISDHKEVSKSRLDNCDKSTDKSNLLLDNASELRKEVEYLAEFMLPERFEKLRSRLDSRTRYMALCLEDIFYPHNASAVIRSAEAFGIQTIHAVQSLCKFTPSQNIVRGTDQWIDLHKWDDTPSLVQHLRESGYRIVVTSPREGGSTPETFDLQAGPFALFMGTEKTGISEWLMSEADEHLHIPMVGFAESLNISVSAAIITNRLTERLRADNSIQWHLSDFEKTELLNKWIRCSIRDVEGILSRMP